MAATSFGTYVTSLALGVLVEQTLGGTALDLGWANAARWAPYLAVGLFAGVVADRVRRRPLLAGTEFGRAAALALLPLLGATGLLTLGSVVGVLLLYGTLSVLGDAAEQSFLPRLVPAPALNLANVRLQQADAAAQGSGPLLAGGVVGLVGAPLTFLVDAVLHVVAGVLVVRTPVDDPRPEPAPRRTVLRDLREGVRWVYGHPTLRPLALSTHAWFLCNAAVSTVTVTYVLTVLDLGATGLGVLGAAAGVGALAGTSLAVRAARWVGDAGTVTGGRLLEAVGVVALVGLPLVGPPLLLAAVGQFVLGLGMGVESPFELSHRQAVTPDRLQGRTNATMRSLNRAVIVVGAPAGGALAVATSARATLLLAAAGIAVGAVALAATGFRHAGHPRERDRADT